MFNKTFCFLSVNIVCSWYTYYFDAGLDTDFHNQELEFPTVTICPIDPIDQDKINETAYRTIASYDLNYYEFIPLLGILPNLTYNNIETASQLYKEALNIDANVEKTFQKSNLREMAFKLGIKCEQFMSYCTYRGDYVPCCEFFEMVYSERGFCYSFNPRYIGLPDEE